MAHAASQLKKKADLELTAAEDEKEKKRRARKRSRETKKKVLPRDWHAFYWVVMVILDTSTLGGSAIG